VLLVTDAAMLATQLLKSPATLAAKGLPVRIKVKIYCYHTTHRAMDSHALQLISQWGKMLTYQIQEAKSKRAQVALSQLCGYRSSKVGIS